MKKYKNLYKISSNTGFDVAKTGDARIGFVGFPSVGKSTLLTTLAGVYSEVAAYEFTTLTTVPGCIKYKGAKIQVKHWMVIIFKTWLNFLSKINVLVAGFAWYHRRC